MSVLNEIVNESKIHPVFVYISGDEGFRPAKASDFAGGGGGSFSLTGNYSVFITGLTSGVVNIPVGAKNWSVAVESGNAYIKNILFNAGTSINIENIGHSTLSSAVSVGCTGGRTIIYYQL